MKLVGFVSAFFALAFLCFGVPVFHASAATFEANGFVYHNEGFPAVEIVATPTDGGIREDVPKRYLERYAKWKAELLSTEFGRVQWDSYASNKGFVLTIKVDSDKEKGAGTDKFQWDDKGSFVGATITLGNEIDDGYPNPIYYPVLNSLSAETSAYAISGKILAASKMSHELGHVSQTARANAALLEKQSKLIPEYTSIFLKNGHNTKDQKLVDLAQQLGGTPIEIWESREYWSEVTAMQFLNERLKDEPFYCYVFNRIRNNVETYARDYVSRFEPGSSATPCK